MDFSNRHTNEFVNLCDLENVLGSVSVCHADSELLLRKSLKNIVIPDSAPESEVGKLTNANHSCHAELVSASYQREMDKFNVNTFLNQIYAFITGKILNIPEPFEYAPSTLQNDTKCMASADVACHCERSEAIQNCHAELVSASRCDLREPSRFRNKFGMTERSTHNSPLTTHCISIGGVK